MPHRYPQLAARLAKTQPFQRPIVNPAPLYYERYSDQAAQIKCSADDIDVQRRKFIVRKLIISPVTAPIGGDRPALTAAGR